MAGISNVGTLLPGKTIRVIGAGLGRTSTTSLCTALKQLLGNPCYHMLEFIKHPDHARYWGEAAATGDTDWRALLQGYGAAVDWPIASFWYEASQAYPDAVIVLSLREPQSWWESANATIFKAMREAPPNSVLDTVKQVFAARFTLAIDNRDACLAAFEAHYADVRARAPAGRLLEWSPQDGWEPLCDRLGVAVPAEPFPRVNTRDEYLRERANRQQR